MAVGDPGQYLIGDTIGQYRIVAELGRGGMGVVYRAHEEALDRDVAIKVLGAHLAEDPSYVERFVREARSAARLNHPNIVQIHVIGEDQGRHYFAMEYVEGSSVQELLRRNGPREPGEAANLVLQTAAGLAAAHDQGVVHRDIKPANILIDRRGLVKIADFGLALMPSSGSRLTATGMFMGTPGYLAPEQCLDQEVGPGTDIYSLGVSYFEMLTGEMPFKAESPFALIRKIVEVQPPDVGELQPGIDDRTRDTLARMMAKDPAQRYGSCHELIEDLREVAGLGASEAVPAQAVMTPPGTPRPADGATASEVDGVSPTVEVDSGSGAAAAPSSEGVTPPPLPVTEGGPWSGSGSPPELAPASRRRLVVAGAAVVALAALGLTVGGIALWSMKGSREVPAPLGLISDSVDDVTGPAGVGDSGVPAGFPVGGAAAPPATGGAVELSGSAGRDPQPADPNGGGEAVGAPLPSTRGALPEGGMVAGPAPDSVAPAAAPTPTPRPVVLSPGEREIRRLVDELRSRDSGTRRNAARAVYRSHPQETRLLEVVNDELLRGFEHNLGDKYHVDAMAWMCNVLGVSGQARYRSTLERVASEASNTKIRKYAAKNVERLR